MLLTSFVFSASSPFVNGQYLRIYASCYSFVEGGTTINYINGTRSELWFLSDNQGYRYFHTSASFPSDKDGYTHAFNETVYYGSQVNNSFCVPCASPNILDANGNCVTPPSPECGFGYSDVGGTCKPDVDCPSAMKYVADSSLGDNGKGCVSNPDITPEECGNKGGKWASKSDTFNLYKDYARIYGDGCFDYAHATTNAFKDSLSLVVSAMVTKNAGAFLTNLARSKFSKDGLDYAGELAKRIDDSPSTNMTNTSFNIADIKFDHAGAYADLMTEARRASFNAGIIEVKDLSISHGTPANALYTAEIIEVEANMIGANSLIGQNIISSLPISAPIAGVIASTVPVIPSLFDSSTPPIDIPVSSTITSSNTASGTTTQNIKSILNYPDGSTSTADSVRTINSDGSSTIQINLQSPIQTTTGTQTLNTPYTITVNNSGSVTNTVSSPSTVTYITPMGSTSTITNTSTTSTTSPITLSNTTDLTSILRKLDSIDNKVADMINFVPDNKVPFDEAMQNFKNGFDNWSLSLDNATNFINGLIDQLNNLKTNFDQSLNMFNNLPTLSLPNGTCPITVNMFNRPFTADACAFVAPYRPILSLFFTFFMTFAVFMFALRYMFNFSMKA